jgi:hypothetical protein
MTVLPCECRGASECLEKTGGEMGESEGDVHLVPVCMPACEAPWWHQPLEERTRSSVEAA